MIIRDLVRLAVYVLEGKVVAINWLSTPKIALGNQSPFDYASTEDKAQEVGDLLNRIENGDFS